MTVMQLKIKCKIKHSQGGMGSQKGQKCDGRNTIERLSPVSGAVKDCQCSRVIQKK